MSKATVVKKNMCGFCPHHCRISVKIADGRLIGYVEDEDNPIAKRFATVVRACPRANAVTEWFYHPGRLNYPLKRAGERGENQWQKISWERALDEIAQKLEEIRGNYGSEAVAINSGGELTLQEEFRARFQNLFGTPNWISHGPVCFCPSMVVGEIVFGWPVPFTGVRLGITRCALLLGANPSIANRRFWYALLEAKRRGTKIIVVDPRRTDVAASADLWLQPKPGTDAALLLGMMNVIINEGLYDREFVAKWCYGFDKLAERVQGYPVERVAEVTWVDAAAIREAARLYATNRPGMIYHSMGLEHIPNSFQAMHARMLLPAIVGNLDVRGGEPLRGLYPYTVPLLDMELADKLSDEQKGKMLGVEQFRLFSWSTYELIQQALKRVWGQAIPSQYSCIAHPPTVFRAMLTGQPYPVRGMITVAQNPVLSFPNTKLVYQALKNLDLYVVMDLFMTPTCQLADYVLPAASWLERPVISTGLDLAPMLDVGEAVLPPVKEGEYDRRTEYDFWRGLGLRLGQERYWLWNSLEEVVDYRLAPLGYNLKDFMKTKGGFDSLPTEYKKYEKTGFATPTGKVELYSTIMEKLGYDPLPRYKEPPQPGEEYPLILITGGRILQYYHSQQRQVTQLRRRHPDPIVQINPKTASQLGIADGDWVWIETPTGKVSQKCQYFEGITPGVVHAEHGWWFPEELGEEPSLYGLWRSNINVVISDVPEYWDEVTGGWALRALNCRVQKVEV